MDKIPRKFKDCLKVEDGIYECTPSDQTDRLNNNVWTILKHDFSEITDEELENLIYVKTIKEGRYLYKTKNDKLLIAIQKTTDLILHETEDDILLYRNESNVFSNPLRQDKFVTPLKPISLDRYESPRPNRKLSHPYRDESPLRKKLNHILDLLGGNRIDSPPRPRKLNLNSFKSKKSLKKKSLKKKSKKKKSKKILKKQKSN